MKFPHEAGYDTKPCGHLEGFRRSVFSWTLLLIWCLAWCDAGSSLSDSLPEDRLAFTTSSSASTSHSYSSLPYACRLESKIQGNPQVHLFWDSQGRFRGSCLRLAPDSGLHSDRQFRAGSWLGRDSLAYLYAHEFWKQSHIAMLALLRHLKTMFCWNTQKNRRMVWCQLHCLFHILKWALIWLTTYCI